MIDQARAAHRRWRRAWITNPTGQRGGGAAAYSARYASPTIPPMTRRQPASLRRQRSRRLGQSSSRRVSLSSTERVQQASWKIAHHTEAEKEDRQGERGTMRHTGASEQSDESDLTRAQAVHADRQKHHEKNNRNEREVGGSGK